MHFFLYVGDHLIDVHNIFFNCVFYIKMLKEN